MPLTELQAFYFHLLSDQMFVDELYERFPIAINSIGEMILNHETGEAWIHISARELLEFMDGNGFEVDWNKKLNFWYSFHIIYPASYTSTSTTSYTIGTYSNDYCSCEVVEIRNPSRRQKRFTYVTINAERYDEIDQPP